MKAGQLVLMNTVGLLDRPAPITLSTARLVPTGSIRLVAADLRPPVLYAVHWRTKPNGGCVCGWLWC